MPTPAVIYAAKSTADKHDSIPTQLEESREKAAEEAWEVVGECQDEGFSAYSGNRGPGLEQARRLAVEAAERYGEPCMLVAQASDRFARGAGDKPGAAESLVEIWHALRRADVHLRTVEDDGDLRDSASVANLGHRAMMESRRKSGAVKKGMKRRRAKGLTHGGKRRFGYRFGENAELIRVEAEQVIVERLYDEFLAGASDAAILRSLIADGVPTALGGKWHRTKVRDILTNPLYAGHLRTADGIVEGAHEGCVPLETWQAAQGLRESRKTQGKGQGRRSAGRHLFHRSMLKCPVCGGAMAPRTNRPTKSRPNRSIAETYVCYERSRDKSLCSMTPLKRAEVDSAVYRYFEQVALDVDATRAQVADSRNRKLTEVRAIAEQAEGEKLKARARLEKIRGDYVEDRISAEDWISFRDELTEGLASAEAEVERLTSQLADIEGWSDLRDIEQETLEKLADLRAAIAGQITDAEGVDAVRAALSRLFEHFTLRPRDLGQRVHAELAWRGGFVIEPKPREHVVEGLTTLRPVFRREAIYDGQTMQGSAG
jgi:DNA invertase Pin-like site-specific DNA recombinase